jgi:MFS transporter, ACDE family, multidrug resistance protein
VSLVALFYNWAFFTVLAYSPFPMDLGIHELGFVFTAWGVLVAVFAVLVAPRLQARFGTARTQYANFLLMALDLLVIALWTDHKAVLIAAVITAGAFIGLSNTLMTQAVMQVSPVDRSVASAAYGFVRFIGGGLAPFAAGKLAAHYDDHVPFYVGAGALLLAIGVLATGHRLIGAADRQMQGGHGGGAEPDGRERDEETGELIAASLGE